MAFTPVAMSSKARVRSVESGSIWLATKTPSKSISVKRARHSQIARRWKGSSMGSASAYPAARRPAASARTRRAALWQVAALERDPGSLFAGIAPAGSHDGHSPLAELSPLETTPADYRLSVGWSQRWYTDIGVRRQRGFYDGASEHATFFVAGFSGRF